MPSQLEKILAHVLRVNRMIKTRHVCSGPNGCEDGFWLGIGLDSKWDWMMMNKSESGKPAAGHIVAGNTVA